MKPAFAGLRVIDTTHVLAGPFASYQLGLLGAEVIKVENPSDPDQARFQGTDQDLVRAGMGTSFLAQGAGKRCLALDLKTPAGRDAMVRLAASADVFVENYRPGAFEEIGLGYDRLSAANPRLIYCSVSAFGASGPRREETGYDNVIQAFSGIMDLTGFGDGRALKCGAPVIDYATGLTAAFAISGALFQREREGQGQHIDVSMLDVAMTLMTSHCTDFLQSGTHPRPNGNEFGFATLGMYRAADADLMIAASNLRQERRLWTALGREDRAKPDNFARIEAYAEDRAILAGIIGARPAAHWEDFLRKNRVPASRVRRMEEALYDDQLRDREQNLTLSDPSGRLDGLQVVGPAFRMSGRRAEPPLPPQPVGAQNAEILRDLGLSDAEVEALCVAGVVRTTANAEP
ncbi:CoA-transferase [Roseivivax halodurans JCM 10272]|uniref:CoA-transferase n=1 Tax=Roseivivax halodurans JCM 10272 TaxID=1449350 RepID=X7EBR1_9RHOB|nr:CaiB/BaiF CoA-transferase family protein [Roseivivax halodurans]ETX13372.1 CoA-transferase [Roseivivax halodurans JCM 10272]